jgi:hypothetical protein
LDRHRHDPERHLPQHVHDRQDDDEAGRLLADDAAESEDNTSLVLVHDM